MQNDPPGTAGSAAALLLYSRNAPVLDWDRRQGGKTGAARALLRAGHSHGIAIGGRGSILAEQKGYRTVRAYGEAEFTEKRSRFIGYAKPVQTEEEALAFLEEIRAKRWDARHNVYAYRLRSGGLMRYSDAGEPQGTAGLPTLEALTKADITDTAIVTTRYFGGILLGTGGLVRAYAKAAQLALQAAGVVTMQRCLQGRLLCEYHQHGAVAKLLPQCGAVLDDTVFGQDVELCFHLLPGELPLLQQKLADATNGAVEIELCGERYYPRQEND